MTMQQSSALRSATLRLLVIPFSIYAAWLLETFLLEGSIHLFERFDPPGIFLYTLIACIITGIVAPLFYIRTTFISGAVNMFHIGFRSLRYTFLACVLTCSIGYGTVIFFNPFGTDRFAFLNAFILLLPGAIASVMICWVLVGTHVQAFVRSGGALLSISVGIMVTTMLYFMTTFAYFPAVLQQEALISSACSGIIAAFFFFAVREVYATSLLVAVCSVFTMAERINPAYVQNAVPYVWISAVLAVSALMGVHWYLSRNYMTLKVPVT
jgi:hypothetical protein